MERVAPRRNPLHSRSRLAKLADHGMAAVKKAADTLAKQRSMLGVTARFGLFRELENIISRVSAKTASRAGFLTPGAACQARAGRGIFSSHERSHETARRTASRS
jgi:hypothetical protein